MCWAFRTLLHELQLRCWMFLSSLARGRPHVSEFCRATSAKCGIPSFCLCLHTLLSRCFALHLAFRLACGLRLLEATCVIGSSLFFPLLFVRVSCLDVVFAEMLLSFVSIFTHFAFVCGWQCIGMFWTHSLCLWASQPKFVITWRSSVKFVISTADETITITIEYLESHWGFLLPCPSSSSVSASFIFPAIRDENSGKSMVPFPSASTQLIMSYNWVSVGFWSRIAWLCPTP